jgi:hypothetical protein
MILQLIFITDRTLLALPCVRICRLLSTLVILHQRRGSHAVSTLFLDVFSPEIVEYETAFTAYVYRLIAKHITLFMKFLC